MFLSFSAVFCIGDHSRGRVLSKISADISFEKGLCVKHSRIKRCCAEYADIAVCCGPAICIISKLAKKLHISLFCADIVKLHPGGVNAKCPYSGSFLSYSLQRMIVSCDNRGNRRADNGGKINIDRTDTVDGAFKLLYKSVVTAQDGIHIP